MVKYMRNNGATALRESEERFRLLIAGVKDYAILMLDPEGRVVTWNAGAAVHGPLDCFQSIDLALGLPTAPGFQHRVSDSVKVLPRSSREALHGVDA